jgi:hypothetical protein
MLRMSAAAAAAVLTAAALAGCAPGPPSWSLVATPWPACARAADVFAAYLATGNPAADAAAYGTQRQYVLSLPAAQQPVYIDQAGDELIAQCGTAQRQTAARRAAAAQARQQAANQRAIAAAQAKVTRVNTAACGRLGGTAYDASETQCANVPYYGTDGQQYVADVTFGSPGIPDYAGAGASSATAAECAAGDYPDGPAGPITGGPRGTWSASAGLCLAG